MADEQGRGGGTVRRGKLAPPLLSPAHGTQRLPTQALQRVSEKQPQDGQPAIHGSVVQCGFAGLSAQGAGLREDADAGLCPLTLTSDSSSKTAPTSSRIFAAPR